MRANTEKHNVAVGQPPPSRNKSITIAITAIGIPESTLSRSDIQDCEVRGQCFSPGDHHSISVHLFASILEKDPDDVRQRVGSGASPFVYMSWTFGRGAPARFETRLILTEDNAAHVKFAHGLEHEYQLDQYMRSGKSFQGPQLPAFNDGTEVERSDALCLDPTQGATCSERHGQPNEERLQDDGSHSSMEYSRPDFSRDYPGNSPSEDGSCQPEEGSYQNEDGPDQWEQDYPGETELDTVDAEVTRQIYDEIWYRQKRDADLRCPPPGEDTSPSRVLPALQPTHEYGLWEDDWRRTCPLRKLYWLDKQRLML